MNIKEFIQSHTFRGIIIGLSLAIVGLIIFQAGVAMGERKAVFSQRFGNTFERNFRGPDGGMMFLGFPGEGQMPGGHGAVGEIISITPPNVIIAGPDNLEKTIVIGTDTRIREFQSELKAGDLQVGDHIIILGEPNEEGQIEAKLVRLLPPPPGVPSDSQPNAR
jgi:hypothetical protein